jgi:transcriptional regulator with PAS, ATPase and Fis domain
VKAGEATVSDEPRDLEQRYGQLRTERIDDGPPPSGVVVLCVMSTVLRRYVLDKDNYLIGRDRDCSVAILDDPAVSLRHARLSRDALGYFVLRDLDTTNGIRELDSAGRATGGRLGEITRLPVGKHVMLGRTEIWLELQVTESQQLAGRHGIIGEAPCMLELVAKIEKVAPRPPTVVLTGESGTGKTKIAKVIHTLSGRKGDKPMLVDCGALPSENAVISELFGHRKGSYTGATEDRPGAFRLAEGGTIFIDEIGELSKEGQLKLLGVLENRVARGLGEGKDYEVDVRVIAATHRDLAKEVEAGRFREDLYYRLSVLELRVPSLRERSMDIPLLIPALMGELGYAPRVWSDEAVSALIKARLPGNVRQLRNIIERALVNAPPTGPIKVEHLGLDGSNTAAADAPGLVNIEGKTLEQIDDEVIIKTVNLHQGNVADAAEALDVPRASMFRVVKKLKDAGRL